MSHPKTTQIKSKSFLLHDVTRHRFAPFVKPVFMPYIPSKLPKSSFVLEMVLGLLLIEIVYVFVFTILEKILFLKA